MLVILLFALGVHGLPLVGPGISRPGPGFVEDISRKEGFLDTQLRWSYCLLLVSRNYLSVFATIRVSPWKRLICFSSVSTQPRKAQLRGLEMETSYVWILVQILMVYWLFRRTGLPTWSDRWMTSWGSATFQPQRCGFLEGSHICLSQPGRPKQAHLDTSCIKISLPLPVWDAFCCFVIGFLLFKTSLNCPILALIKRHKTPEI